MIKHYILVLLLLPFLIYSQNNSGEIHGDFNLSLQSYKDDVSINAQGADEVILNNSYFNLIYTWWSS